LELGIKYIMGWGDVWKGISMRETRILKGFMGKNRRARCYCEL
jgi:hypothetical protein